MERVSTIGLDLAKQVFQVHGLSKDGKKVFSRKLEREELHAFFKKQRGCVVAMEATSSAHHWARLIAILGHTPRLIPAQYVKPYLKREKSDALDAEAIANAARQPGMRFVAIKSADQQSITTLMKTRTLFIRQRTSAVNSLRGLLAEFGFVVPARLANVAKLKRILHSDEMRVPEVAWTALKGVYQHIEAIDQQIEAVEKSIDEEVSKDATVQRLMTVPGVGKITAMSIRAFVPDAALFKSARHFASWLGITPRSISSGGKQLYGHISKRGNAELRKLLVLGAFPIVTWAKKPACSNPWLRSLANRKPYKVAAVAVAHRTARIVWSLLSKGGTYRPLPDETQAISS